MVAEDTSANSQASFSGFDVSSVKRGVEHKSGVRSSNESSNGHHAETTDHDIHPDYVEILERNVNNSDEGNRRLSKI